MWVLYSLEAVELSNITLIETDADVNDLKELVAGWPQALDVSLNDPHVLEARVLLKRVEYFM